MTKEADKEDGVVIVEATKIPPLTEIKDVPLDDPIKVYKVCQQLQALCEKEHGIGVSAVQVGIPWKLFLVKGDGSCPLVPAGEYGYFVNCEYEPITEDERVVSLEGCLSLRSPSGQLRSFKVERYNKIRLHGLRLIVQDLILFDSVDAELGVDQEGIVFQHEIDHHFGVLISDIGQELFIW